MGLNMLSLARALFNINALIKLCIKVK